MADDVAAEVPATDPLPGTDRSRPPEQCEPSELPWPSGLGKPSEPGKPSGLAGLTELLRRPAPTYHEVRYVLDELDRITFPTGDLDLGCVDLAEQIAVREGWPDLQLRADLLRAWQALEDGDLVRAASIVNRVSGWARETGDQVLLARTHSLLASLYRGIGDPAEALSQSVQAVATTPADADVWIRTAHLNGLATGLIVTRSVGPAMRRFEEALALAESTGDPALQVLVLNNMAFGSYELGDHESARRFGAQMQQVSRRHGVLLRAFHRETLARIEMSVGHYREAEELLEPVVARPSGPLHSDLEALPACLLALAESQRRRGALDQAEATLARCAVAVADRHLEQLAAMVLQERARLHADCGRYREAYEELTRFHGAWQALQDAQREVRACVAHALYEVEETRRDRDQFRELATRDPLTGLHNRRVIEERIPAAIAAAESGTPFSIALLDLDHFKRINDTRSHETGDLVLQQVATLTCAAVPASASVIRMGGEEFLVILPECDADAAAAHGERLRLAIQDHDWSAVTGGLPVTVSVGLATCTAATTVPALLAAADRHLYAAKQGGRNRVASATTGRPDASPRPSGRRRYRDGTPSL